ncbi:unnamed protein product [Phytophthora fragariaefolia]|uniref:Unnamed protein product n=1 Tax=Phytophthora fragariaefolia TaxID=1490495 RepID=A0A9W6U2F5_9STRA|nr:unnamed protein product [Phytophthora fragariaefolia]
MAQYKTYRFTSSLTGAGVEPGTNRVLLDPSVWSELIQTADANTQCTYRQLQKTGFAHADVCALLAGDAVVTGEEDGSIGDFDAGVLHQVTEPAATPAMPAAASCIIASSTTDRELPASHQQRTNKLKRLRDGRSKASAAASASAGANDRALEAFIAVCKASEEVFKKRSKPIDAHDGAENAAFLKSGEESP